MRPGKSRVAVRTLSVVDGDSLQVRPADHSGSASQAIPVRLYAIDAPERGQYYYRHSRSHLEELAKGPLFLDALDIDQYGRVIAVVYRNSPEDSLNRAMVRDGWARYAPQYDDSQYGRWRLKLEAAETQARKRRRGIWQDRNYDLAPWDYRRLKRQGSNVRQDHRSARRRGGDRGCCLIVFSLKGLLLIGFSLLLAYIALSVLQ